MLPSVRPLRRRWSCGPVWEFADRYQIINVCSRHDEYIWFFRPRLADCCAIPSFDRLRPRQATLFKQIDDHRASGKSYGVSDPGRMIGTVTRSSARSADDSRRAT